MDKGQLKINLLTASFEIQAEETSEHLQSIYEYYVNTVEELMKMSTLKDPLKVAILAGLVISDELFKERIRASEFPTDIKTITEFERSARRMIAKIDNIITN